VNDMMGAHGRGCPNCRWGALPPGRSQAHDCRLPESRGFCQYFQGNPSKWESKTPDHVKAWERSWA